MGVQASDRLTIRQYQAHTQHKRKKNVQCFLSLLSGHVFPETNKELKPECNNKVLWCVQRIYQQPSHTNLLANILAFYLLLCGAGHSRFRRSLFQWLRISKTAQKMVATAQLPFRFIQTRKNSQPQNSTAVEPLCKSPLCARGKLFSGWGQCGCSFFGPQDGGEQQAMPLQPLRLAPTIPIQVAECVQEICTIFPYYTLGQSWKMQMAMY